MRNVFSGISGSFGLARLLQVAAAFAALAFAQQGGSLPSWPGEREAKARLHSERVFLSQDGASVKVVLGSGEETEIVEVPLLNQMLPTVRCSMIRVAGETYSYTYYLENGRSARDPIGRWSLVVPMEAETLTQHRNVSASQHWGSSTASAPVGLQIIPETPNGKYVTWVANYQEDRERPVILPGRSAGGFELSSNFLPGFTTAYFLHWRYVSLDREWPDAVQAQIADFWNSPLRRNRHLLTFGPQFAGTEPDSVIAEHFLKGLRVLAERALIDVDSAFIRDVVDILSRANIEPVPDEERIILHSPQTEFEEEIATALQLSLRVRAAAEAVGNN